MSNYQGFHDTTEGKEAIDKARSIIAGAYGSVNFYEHRYIAGIIYTDGVREIAEALSCHWLIDIVVSHQVKDEVCAESFQEWRLEKDSGHGHDVIATDGGKGSGFITIATQKLESGSDFPEALMPFKMWLVRDGGTRQVLMLPGEY